MNDLRARIAGCDWPAIRETLIADGVVVLPRLLEADRRAELRAGYADTSRFRSRIVMERHNFGRGEYQYFAYPLPALVQTLRRSLYRQLVPVANRWARELGEKEWPGSHREFTERCRAAGQQRPTPLLLRYGAGDYNCLHQDLYGGIFFPLQVVFLLSEPDRDFEGGELIVVEQRPHMQSKPRVVCLRAGEGAAFAVSRRPVQGKRGVYRATMRHGVSEVRRGERLTLGIIFHDAA